MIRLFFVLLIVLYLAVGIGTMIPPAAWFGGARVLPLHSVFVFAAAALPLYPSLMLAFLVGLVWDLMTIPIDSTGSAIFLGWSVIYFGIVAFLLQGFGSSIAQGRWEAHAMVAGIVASLHVLLEFLQITLVRSVEAPPEFTPLLYLRIFGTGSLTLLVSPLVYYFLMLAEHFCGRPVRSQLDPYTRPLL